MHKFRIELHRRGELEPIDAGFVTFEGRDYDTFDEAQALTAIMPGGDGHEQLDLSLPGFIRWRGILMPVSDFQSLRVELVSKSK